MVELGQKIGEFGAQNRRQTPDNNACPNAMYDE